jgi:hypothetical protein
MMCWSASERSSRNRRRRSRVLSVVFLQGERDIVAYVPELPGAHAQGSTVEEARGNLADALALLLAPR